jgi:hypothetical protein
MGYDIEQWRGELGLSKFEAQAALGFRNANHYNKICLMEIIPVSIEIIVRLYLEFPKARGWKKYSLQELFNLMYGEQLAVFEGRPDYTAARVDLGNRFTRLFDRSSSRKYNWLRDDDRGSGSREFGGAYSDVETILAILKEVPNPKEVFERVAIHVFTLRGVDIEHEHRVPTLDLPPVRRKTGRRRTKPAVKRSTRARIPAPRALGSGSDALAGDAVERVRSAEEAAAKNVAAEKAAAKKAAAKKAAAKKAAAKKAAAKKVVAGKAAAKKAAKLAPPTSATLAAALAEVPQNAPADSQAVQVATESANVQAAELASGVGQ